MINSLERINTDIKNELKETTQFLVHQQLIDPLMQKYNLTLFNYEISEFEYNDEYYELPEINCIFFKFKTEKHQNTIFKLTKYNIGFINANPMGEEFQEIYLEDLDNSGKDFYEEYKISKEFHSDLKIIVKTGKEILHILNSLDNLIWFAYYGIEINQDNFR